MPLSKEIKPNYKQVYPKLFFKDLILLQVKDMSTVFLVEHYCIIQTVQISLGNIYY